MKKCVMIYNPNSGRGNVRHYLGDIVDLVSEYGYEIEVIGTKYKKHAISIVRDLKNVDLVMSFGGDGTFNEVMQGNLLRRKRVLIAHIPVGTTNDVGIMFGYGKNILDNVKMTLEGEVKQMDICMINNIPFIYVAGFGKYMNISYSTSSKSKHQFGYLAYLKNGIKEFFSKTKMYDISYVVDGKEYRGLFSLVLISSANHIAGMSNIYQNVKLDDNRFEVLFCNIRKKHDLLKSLYFLTKYDFSRVPGLYFYRTDRLKICFHNKGRESWTVDGERLEEHGDVFQVKNVNGVCVLMPKKNIKKLFVHS